MTLRVIGFGVGRTGTFSTKLALEELGFGRCHHMEEVVAKSADQVGLWRNAADGKVDWHQAYEGFSSALDWPTAAFCPELVKAFPDAKFLLTVRDTEKWYKSFSETIYPLVTDTSGLPPDVLPFIEMVIAVIRKTGFDLPSTRDAIIAAYHRHNDTVKRTVPAGQLLVFDVREGWEPLCKFLGCPVPAKDFPRTNNIQDFWDSVRAG